MAAKTNRRNIRKAEKFDDPRDELDLRDEILELKRELAAVRRDKDKLSIKLRKSEEEQRKKDKQIEHLMDPSQNSEIRRLLSVKGAALLLNLKDQNNTLLQMLMEKNQQIRKMGGEIKTAKLYSRTSKTQPYRVEITRLRSLLLQSQEALKEAAQHPHLNQVCLSGHSSTSSEEVTSPSPQELEDLRYMVQSLETHMQHSKQLLAKKNQEISWLTRELQGLMGEHRCCREPEAIRWKVESSREKYDSKDRRCTSAPILEPFQTPDSEKRLKKKEQVAFLEKKPKRRPSIREKWKSAVQKVQKSVSPKVHTNPNADDELVWSVLQQPEVDEVVIELEASPRDESVKPDEDAKPKSDSETPEEFVSVKRSLYQLSLDSSVESESEVKNIEVEAEINARDSPETEVSGTGNENEVFKKGGKGGNCFGGKGGLRLEFFDDEEEDDDDVITI